MAEKIKATSTEDAARQVVKKKRTRPDLAEKNSFHTEPGDNTKFIRHSLRVAELGRVDENDPVAVEERCYEYFKVCEEDDMKPSIAGLALALDMDRVHLWKVREGVVGKNTAVKNTIKRACRLLDLQMTDYMQNGKINPVSGIFLMKNNFGYTDKQEVVVTPNNPMGEEKNVAELKDKYIDDIVVDDWEEKK